MRPFWALFASTSTLVCCALPALFVALGAGASLGALLTTFPQLIWFSQNKEIVFAFSGLMIFLGYWNLWRTRNDPCPIEPELARACKTGKKISLYVLSASVFIYGVGVFFAFFLG
jgi:hypothetical protein